MRLNQLTVNEPQRCGFRNLRFVMVGLLGGPGPGYAPNPTVFRSEPAHVRGNSHRECGGLELPR